MEFRTNRLLLRPWHPDDADDVAAAYDIYRRWEVVRWLGAQPKVWPDEPATRERLTRWNAFAEANPGYGCWAVAVADASPSGRPVGTVLLMPLRDGNEVPTGHVEVGWHFHPDAWGQGYATEASQALLEHAWALGLPEVEAIAFADNAASIKVMERLGMSYQGETDQWYGTTFTWYRIERPASDAGAVSPTEGA